VIVLENKIDGMAIEVGLLPKLAPEQANATAA
jgi:hypothetical protein